ncbi:MAG: sigma-54-dependent Fis family transcriptional regulator [Nitrospirae bacterium]|nr:sigma-54-dependent Fis family transcriptional regulator [Nitrospirota bacterium]NTW65348.1 sigma-54-dependent Fis family transcriptional regulator [Nitrospirota bacterium]
MQTILLLTTQSDLADELRPLLPKGHKLVVAGPRPATAEDGDSFIFIDIDTVGVERIREYAGRTFVIAITEQERTGPVMEAATFGAYEIMRRPLRKERIDRVLTELKDLRAEMAHAVLIDKDLIAPAATCVIVGRSTLVMSLCEKVARIAQVEVPVLVTGETGTGKELVAEAIAQLSSRFGKPFVVINSAAVPEALLESELFGYERGAFTGAVSSKEGMLRTADGGCVFFDEIGELPLALQGKLLRFLQTQSFYPVGSTKEVQVNVRVISATNRDLATMVREGKFREDLYHRLRVALIHVPPLRERKKDIVPLVQCLFYRHAHTAQKAIKGVTEAFLDGLLAYDWPGNIRELENTLRSAIALCKTEYLTTHELKDLGAHSLARPAQGHAGALASAVVPFVKDALERKDKNIYEKVHAEVDRHLLEYALSHTRENQSEAARLLGINRLTLRKKLGLSK